MSKIDIDKLTSISDLITQLRRVQNKIDFISSDKTYKFTVVVTHRDNSSRPYEYTCSLDSNEFEILQEKILEIDEAEKAALIVKLINLGVKLE